MMDTNQLSRLRFAIEHFVILSDEDWSLLIPHISYLSLKKKEKWIMEGEKEKHIGFILEGNMRHYYISDGEERTTYFYFENALVSSYFSALSALPSKLTIEALTTCELLSFPYPVLVSLFEHSHGWERFGRKLAEYIALGLEDRMVKLLVLSPEHRYAELLKSGKNKIIERIPQHLIANYLGVSPVSLSRIRRRVGNKK
jgi:CRP-like cAMP-binding protein